MNVSVVYVTESELCTSVCVCCVFVQHEAELEKGLLKTTDMAKKKDSDVVHSAAMGKALKIMERMVNQNAEVRV